MPTCNEIVRPGFAAVADVCRHPRLQRRFENICSGSVGDLVACARRRNVVVMLHPLLALPGFASCSHRKSIQDRNAENIRKHYCGAGF